MSLVHPVSSVEGFDREREEDLEISSLLLTKTLSHKISYDIFPSHGHEIVPGLPETVEGVGAYEVPALKRAAQVFVGCMICILASGVTFGFAALKSILVDLGTYRDLCTPKEVQKDTTICYLQDQRFVMDVS